MGVKGQIENPVLRNTIWHHEACRVMPNGDPEGQIFLSHPHKNNGFLFLYTIEFHIFIQNKLPEVPEYSEMQYYMMMSL